MRPFSLSSRSVSRVVLWCQHFYLNLLFQWCYLHVYVVQSSISELFCVTTIEPLYSGIHTVLALGMRPSI